MENIPRNYHLRNLSLGELRQGLENAGTPDQDREILACVFLAGDENKAVYGILYRDGHEELACGKVYAKYSYARSRYGHLLVEY